MGVSPAEIFCDDQRTAGEAAAASSTFIPESTTPEPLDPMTATFLAVPVGIVVDILLLVQRTLVDAAAASSTFTGDMTVCPVASVETRPPAAGLAIRDCLFAIFELDHKTWALGAAESLMETPASST